MSDPCLPGETLTAARERTRREVDAELVHLGFTMRRCRANLPAMRLAKAARKALTEGKVAKAERLAFRATMRRMDYTNTRYG